MSITVDPAGLIGGLRFKPGSPLPIVNSLDDLAGALTGLGINASFTVFDVTDSGSGTEPSCSSTHSFGPSGAHPLGSMFKLYVLGAVVRAVADGTVTWDQRLVVRDRDKSLPSGRLQDQPDGTTVTVQQAAELMISISDNTAADLLISTVGRPAVERAVAAMGAAEPALLRPFPNTRQIFTLDGNQSLRAAWAEASAGLVLPHSGVALAPSVSQVVARAQILAKVPPGPPTLGGLTGPPGWVDGLEWFASAADLCRAHADLQAMAATPAGRPVRQILAKNPGVDVGTGWQYVAFKGGSDNGVLGGSWYLQSKDGSRHVLVVQLSATDATKVPDDQWFAVAVGGAIRSMA